MEEDEKRASYLKLQLFKYLIRKNLQERTGTLPSIEMKAYMSSACVFILIIKKKYKTSETTTINEIMAPYQLPGWNNLESKCLSKTWKDCKHKYMEEEEEENEKNFIVN